MVERKRSLLSSVPDTCSPPWAYFCRAALQRQGLAGHGDGRFVQVEYVAQGGKSISTSQDQSVPKMVSRSAVFPYGHRHLHIRIHVGAGIPDPRENSTLGIGQVAHQARS